MQCTCSHLPAHWVYLVTFTSTLSVLGHIYQYTESSRTSDILVHAKAENLKKVGYFRNDEGCKTLVTFETVRVSRRVKSYELHRNIAECRTYLPWSSRMRQRSQSGWCTLRECYPRPQGAAGARRILYKHLAQSSFRFRLHAKTHDYEKSKKHLAYNVMTSKNKSPPRKSKKIF